MTLNNIRSHFKHIINNNIKIIQRTQLSNIILKINNHNNMNNINIVHNDINITTIIIVYNNHNDIIYKFIINE